MTRLSYSSRNLRDERGAFLPFLVLGLPVLLLFGVLLLDIGQLYRAKIFLQKAADLGSLAGIGYSASMHSLSADELAKAKETIEEKAQEVTEENLLLNGINNPTVNTLYDVANKTLDVRVSADIPVLLGFYSDTASYNLETSAQSVRDRANVSLILDFSSSMLCPASGDCTCLTPARVQDCVDLGVQMKYQDLLTAVAAFIDEFDPAYDRIGVSVFNMAGQTLIPIADESTQGFDEVAINTALAGLTPQSNTNMSDGIIRAQEDIANASLTSSSEEVAYVIFSDGGPTASRFLLNDAKGALTINDPDGFGSYDYTMWDVNWNTTYTGPSLLVRSQFISYDYNDPRPPVGSAGTYVPTCSPSAVEPPSDSADFDTIFEGCLNNLSFHMPGLTDGYGTACGGSSGGNPRFSECWRQQYFHNVVQLSDSLREQNGIIYTIGLGDGGSVSAAIGKSDPYQDIDDPRTRHDILLSRIANDYIEATSHSTLQYGGMHPEFSYSGYSNYSTLRANGTRQQGRYYPTPTSNELKEAFISIANRILLRLTN